MKISVIGTGYVGLVTGTCLAEKGNDVICVDNNQEKLEILKQGKSTIYEPGLQELLTKNIQLGSIEFTSDLQYAVTNSEVIFFCLPTPPLEDGSADLKYVLQVSNDIAPYLKQGHIIVNKSTVPVGTGQKVFELIKSETEIDFEIVSNPEFLREGYAVSDFLKPDRVVIGTSSEIVKEKMQQLYKDFVTSNDQIIFMDIRSSELTKYAANCFLATKISFMNEVANLAEYLGANIDSVKAGIGSDERIGNKFLNAGIGYGGSCFPKDVAALNNISKNTGYNFQILEVITKVNQNQKNLITQKVKDFVSKNGQGKKLAIWGLSFKPDTDDIREAPSLEIIPALLDLNFEIQAYDPEAMENVKRYYNFPINFFTDKYQALVDAEALLILTEWQEFKDCDIKKVLNFLKKPIIIDGRNTFDLSLFDNLTVEYYSIGRPAILNINSQ